MQLIPQHDLKTVFSIPGQDTGNHSNGLKEQKLVGLIPWHQTFGGNLIRSHLIHCINEPLPIGGFTDKSN